MLLPLLTVLAVAGAICGLVAVRTGRARHLAVMAHPLVALAAAAGVVAIAAAGQWWITHTVLGNAFAPTANGWARVSAIDIDIATALAALTRVQTTAAGCVGVLVGLSWICVLLYDPRAERSARVASGAAVVAVSLPVLAACLGVQMTSEAMLEPSAGAAMWSAWHALEASKWLVAGLAATGLMAATPIVVHAASRGHVVGPRLYQLAQAILLVGLAAWSTSRFASEDLVRGPMAALSRGQAPWRADARTRAVPTMNAWAMQLPAAARCSDVGMDRGSLHVLPLQLGAHGTEHAGPSSWSAAPEGDVVVAAAIDRRAPAKVFTNALVHAQSLGATHVAVVTMRVDEETSLTLGTLRSDMPCVLGWIGMAHALRLASDGGRWNTLAYAAAHTDDPQFSTAARPE